jgi:RNA polymerase sigma-70 factor (ECF subfamily)
VSEATRLLEQIRAGDADAGHRFVREHYHAIYRYLLYLTEQPDQAEDLTQETFLQGWRYLDTFRGRGSLRGWLLRIARREFAHLLRRRQDEPGSEGLEEVAAPAARAGLESVELRAVIDRLPLEQREVVLLHYLEGFSSAEIAPILGIPGRTVRLRLEQARERLRQELGEDDLTYLNEPVAPMRRWAWLPLDRMRALEARLGAPTLCVGPGSGAEEDTMERREFLRCAAAGAVGLAAPNTEKEADGPLPVVDSRLTQKVTLAFKATALSDVCEHLREKTGVRVAAGASVADEKVTLFCRAAPLREVMRQLSRPFGYAWARSTKEGESYYELLQDLRSQLLEEELRNRDRHAALLALEREIERYRPYLGLSPDEALARSKTAPPAEKKLLEAYAGWGWGPIQMYFRLSHGDLEALRAGQSLMVSAEPEPGHRTLPQDLARGVLQSLREWRLIKEDQGFRCTSDPTHPEGLVLTTVPEVRAWIKLEMPQRELGQRALRGLSGFFTHTNLPRNARILTGEGAEEILVVGRSPATVKPGNSTTNVRLAHDPALQARVSVETPPSCGSKLHPKVTSADAFEAIYRATGIPIVSDYYTRLYAPEDVSVRNTPLFEALNQLADTMRLRWGKDESWLQFRSTGFYDDRLKEVPNRFLTRWAASRRQHGTLTLEDLVEIAQLPDTQLDARDMAEGAKACFGLAEWDLVCYKSMRPDLRFLAAFTPAQRQEAASGGGLAFSRMSLAQQQQFLALGVGGASLQSLEELAGAVLRVDYSVPGWFQWGNTSSSTYTRWVVPLEPGPRGARVLRPLVREQTREAALQAVRRIDPSIREALLRALRRKDPRVADTPYAAEEEQILPTQLGLAIAYIPGLTNARGIWVVYGGNREGAAD